MNGWMQAPDTRDVRPLGICPMCGDPQGEGACENGPCKLAKIDTTNSVAPPKAKIGWWA